MLKHLCFNSFVKPGGEVSSKHQFFCISYYGHYDIDCIPQSSSCLALGQIARMFGLRCSSRPHCSWAALI